MELFRKKMPHGLDFANAKSGKKKSKKETALAGSNPCDICSMRLNPVGSVLRARLVLLYNVSKKDCRNN